MSFFGKKINLDSLKKINLGELTESSIVKIDSKLFKMVNVTLLIDSYRYKDGSYRKGDEFYLPEGKAIALKQSGAITF